MDPTDCLLVPGVSLRGVNLAPKAAHVATGHAYRALFSEWDWAGWIKPQIDAALAAGANAVRLIGDLEGVNDGTFNQAYYDAKWAQLITYADGLGMYVYPAGGGVSQATAAGLDAAAIGATVAAAADAWDAYDNVIGIDVLQEGVRVVPSNSIIQTSPAAIFTPIRAVTTKPLTTSNAADATYSAGRLANPRWRETLRAYVDFWDIHIYFKPTATVLYDCFWGQGEDKPVLIGEFGSLASEADATRVADFQRIADVANRRLLDLRPAGAFVWAAFDQDASAAASWGMFNTDGTVRADLDVPFQRIPIT